MGANAATAKTKDTPTHRRPSAPLRETWLPWIDGRAVEPRAMEFTTPIDPATGESLGRVAKCQAAEVDQAVSAAKRALPAWANMPVAKRRRLLIEIADAMRAHIDELGTLECLNNGKPLNEARIDSDRSADGVEFYAGMADKLFGATIPTSPEFVSYTVREPMGVTAHFAPWNFPIRLAMRSVAPALAAGNTVVLKPGDETPLTALRLGEIFAEAGLPAGVYNVVPGVGREAGAALAAHPGVQHIAFTGSVATGIEVMKNAANNVVPVVLELGGKSPNIIFADADVDLAIEGAIKAIFANAGQVCCAGSRLLVEEKFMDTFVPRLIERTRKLRVGPGIDNSDMGPLIAERQRKRVLDYVELGRREGGEVLCGGKAPSDPACSRGFFVEPTLIARVNNCARVAQEEIFGPVLTIIPFRSLDEAIEIANESEYGLVAGVWTNDLNIAHHCANRIQAGQVYINDFFSGSIALPFGGYKRSGFGRERGVEALGHYTQTKSVCVRLTKG